MSTGLRIGLVAACAAAGCLPAGDAPRGQHLLDGRDDLSVMFQRTIPGAPTRLLLLGDTPDSGDGLVAFSIFDVTAPDPATGRSQKKFLADHILFGDQRCEGCPYAFDARGRLVLPQEGLVASSFEVSLLRVDLATSEQVDLGPINAASFSADRSLLLLARNELWSVRDLDDHETPLPDTKIADMVGNDVYFVSPGNKLFRLRGTALTDQPELAADAVANFLRVDTHTGPLLLLSRPALDPYVPTTHALFDPATFEEAPLPGETGPTSNVVASPSPTGKLVLFSFIGPRANQTLALYDRDTGATRTEDIDGFLVGSSWRPGHDDVWIELQGGMLRWRAGEAPERLPGFGGGAFVQPSASIFTPDGRFWLSSEIPAALRDADDVAAKPLALHPLGTTLLNYWPLPDGRGIAEDFTTYQLHADLSLVDPVARTFSPIATGGYVVAVGGGRVLALLDFVKSTSSGTLTLIDVDTGARTVLGENVHDLALDTTAADRDRLAPGQRVAFLVRNRLAGPYDGLWVATLP